MAPERLTPEQIKQVSGLVAQYITDQRAGYAPRALPLSAEQTTAMAGFFSPQLLEEVRLLHLRREHVANPSFYPMLRNIGFTNLPDQSRMGAITFRDVVVSHQPFSSPLLFHELVHAEQYRQLGVEHFAELYVAGFLRGGRYEAIPLEVNAYDLGRRYEANPQRVFQVADEVCRWVTEGRF